jgi:4-hydroxythreonine-4-phosphate dehydrogenase
MNDKIRVGITLGDVNGIGPEVVVKALADIRMADMFTPVVYGSARALKHYRGAQSEEFQFTAVATAAEARDKRVNLVECMDGSVEPQPGVASAATGKMAGEALRRAVADNKAGLIDVIVTAPIDKETADLGHTGHTEFFAAGYGGEPLMMMCSEVLKVGLVTTHLPLHEVSGKITKERITGQLKRLRHALVQDFGIVEPRIAVLALNPHSGDGGLLGDEEKTTIKPAIGEAIGAGVLAFGPFPADGFFAAGSYAKYDAVLAMYHDQGLVPFKTLTPEGVNFTAGLPVVRTSPDHGVAYDIAGADKADPASMREAIYLALDVFRRRARYAEMTRNPLQHFEREKGHKDLSVKDLIPEVEQGD